MKPSNALACLFLSTLIAACDTKTVYLPSEPIPVFTPDRFLVPCAIPAWKGGSWLDVPKLAEQRYFAMVACNEQMRLGRQWNADQKATLAK